MGHTVVPEAEKWLDREIPVLDRGFVRLVDYMGGDERIVQTARVSYGAGTKTVREDAGLIDYLMRHQHTSPFEHVVLELHCKMPIFVARQWIRHRTARLNEISGRYSVLEDEFYLPPPGQIRRQSRDNKQGRGEDEVPAAMQRRVLDILKQEQHASYATYQSLLHDDIARELARINLPVSLYTQWYWQMDLHNLFHFLELRLDPHAQWEIREYARAIGTLARAVAPMAYASFERHVLHGKRLSGDEIAAVRALLRGEPNPLAGRRLAEFEGKLFGREDAPPPPPRPPGPAPARPGPAPRASAAPAEPPAAPAPAEPAVVHGWRASLSRDEINELPLRQYEGPVHVVREDREMDAMIAALRQAKLVGFDTESRPSFQPGQNYPVAILQFATAEAAYVVQLKPLAHWTRLWEVLSDPEVVKVGIALDQDLRKLQELHPFKPAGFVDLALHAGRMGFKKTGLRGLAASILGIRISKGAQRSNWARDVLTPQQVAYAATDAWAARELHLAIRLRQDAASD